MAEYIEGLLGEFCDEKKVNKSKGLLALVVGLTRVARDDGLPIEPNSLVAKSGGQVTRIGRSITQKVLGEYGIDRLLAAEGGRTSRGSINNMKAYIGLLNDFHSRGIADLARIEEWWIERVREFFAAKPFKLNTDASKSMRAIIHELLDQAKERQKESPGSTFVGTIIQHLVGAKLDLILNGIDHHGSAVSDDISGREGDFVLGDTSIHVTTAPGELLIGKCLRNLGNALRPIIVTVSDRVHVAIALAETAEIHDRIDVLDVEQFLAGNLYEHGRFEREGRIEKVCLLIEKYNSIIDKCETDPSLKIFIK